jgi:hypothetical protein
MRRFALILLDQSFIYFGPGLPEECFKRFGRIPRVSSVGPSPLPARQGKPVGGLPWLRTAIQVYSRMREPSAELQQSPRTVPEKPEFMAGRLCCEWHDDLLPPLKNRLGALPISARRSHPPPRVSFS